MDVTKVPVETFRPAQEWVEILQPLFRPGKPLDSGTAAKLSFGLRLRLQLDKEPTDTRRFILLASKLKEFPPATLITLSFLALKISLTLQVIEIARLWYNSRDRHDFKRRIPICSPRKSHFVRGIGLWSYMGLQAYPSRQTRAPSVRFHPLAFEIA